MSGPPSTSLLPPSHPPQSPPTLQGTKASTGAMSHTQNLPSPPLMEDRGKSTVNGKARSATATTDRASPSVLYTLLQDLGLTETAQALCEELQRQHASANAAPAQSTALSTASAPQSPSPLLETLMQDPPGDQQPSLLSSTSMAVQSQSLVTISTPPPPILAKAFSPLSPGAEVAPTEVEGSEAATQCTDLQNGDAGSCTSAIAALAACAVEPLHAACDKSTLPVLTTVAAIEAALRTLWKNEVNAVNLKRSASTKALCIPSLLARAAWCELQMTEMVFLQEYHLARSSSRSSSAVTAFLHDAQEDLVDHALQLVAALQELLAITGSSVAGRRIDASDRDSSNEVSSAETPAAEDSLSTVIMSQLHAKALEWLRNAECVMAWVLQRQAYFEAPTQKINGEQHPPQHRKRRCVEHTPTQSNHCAWDNKISTNNDVVPQHLQPLRNAVLGIASFTEHGGDGDAAGGGVRVPTFYQQCLAAESTQTPHGKVSPHAVVRLPSAVRLAMTVQRIKLLLTLVLASAYNCKASIVCTVVKAASAAAAATAESATPGSNGQQPAQKGAKHGKNTRATEGTADVVRSWWSWRCVMQARLLQQITRHLRSLGQTDAAASATAAALRSGSKCEHEVLSLITLLDTQARQLLLSPNSVEAVEKMVYSDTPAAPHRSRLSFAVNLLNALEREQSECAAWLDRFTLEYASTVHLPKQLSLTTTSMHSSSDTLPSPNISVGSPGARSETSSSSSPVWMLPLPNLPPTTTPAIALAGARKQSLGASPPARPAAGVNATEFAADAAAGCTAILCAAQVLQWQPHFAYLLTTIATGRWQAPTSTRPIAHPCSQYNRTRLNIISAVCHAQELMRLQPRRLVAANGCEYVPRPGVDASTEAPLSLVEQMPRVMQLFTLQDAHVLRRTQRRLAAWTAKAGDGVGLPDAASAPRKSSASKTAAPLSPQQRRHHGRTSAPPAAPPPVPSSLPFPPAAPLEGSTNSNSNAVPSHRGAALTSLISTPAPTAGADPLLLRRLAATVRQACEHAAASAAATTSANDGGNSPDAVNTSQESASNNNNNNNSSDPNVQTSLPPLSTGAGPEAGPERATWSPDSAATETEESLEGLRERSSSAPSPPALSWENEEHPSTQRDSDSSTVSSRVGAVREENVGSGNGEDSDEEAAISIYDPELEGHAGEEVTDEETDEEWPQSAVEVDEDEEGSRAEGSEASSADLDYERVEDAMKEEVECVEVTGDGRLMALLTARGRLTVLRLQAPDSRARYEEELLLDTLLPRVPKKRLQWYESLSSFVHFSPCHRFVLASVQYLTIHEKPNTRGALARMQNDNAGEVCVFSLHCDDDGSEDAEKRRGGQCTRSQSATPRASTSGTTGTPTATTTFADHMQHLLYPLPERLYECFRPHTAPCLSARWVDSRWWGGGRRSRWANSAAEPLNTTTAAAAVVVRGAEGSSSTQRSRAHDELRLLPDSWRVAAAVLLSEYQCLSIGSNDMILRWMPSSGVVLQCIATEPVQDLLVSPMMAAFYVISDAGDLLMYDAWDERDVGEVSSNPSIWANSRDVCEHEAHPLMLPVTDDGHPHHCRIGASTQSLEGTAGALPRRSLMNEEGNPAAASGALDDAANKTRQLMHYTGPVTPVFQRMIDPVEKRRRRMQTFQGSSSGNSAYRRARARGRGLQGDDGATHPSGEEHDEGLQEANGDVGRHRLPRSLRWLLPHRWAVHTPWDSQLGRRILQHLLHRSSAPTYAAEGQLCYEQEEDVEHGVDYSQAVGNRLSRGGRALKGNMPAPQRHQHNAGEDGADTSDDSVCGFKEANEDSASDYSSDFAADEAAEPEEEQLWEYDYTNSTHCNDDGVRPPQLSRRFPQGKHENVVSATAAAAARDTPVAVRECPSHPTPARGTLRRAYYPSGACLVYKSVARALCVAGDLADRQRNEEMGPGGLTHHLLSFAISGEPQWTEEGRLWKRDEGGEREDEKDVSMHEASDGAKGKSRCVAGPHNSNGTNAVGLPTTPTHWPTTALARVILWKNRLSTLRHLDHLSLDVWAQWEAAVLNTTFHADLMSNAHADTAKGASIPTWSVAELLSSRGFHRARDVWRRGAPAAQRSLAVTARNGRYLCMMASVGPYRKLVNSREPLRNMKGFYACVVFDVYAGTQLRVIPVCPVDPSGLHGLSMYTSQQHEMDIKMPLYRLQCSLSIVPVAAANPRANGSSTSTEDAEPKEILLLTVGGLANTVYVFDALNGRRIACSRGVEHQCGVSAAAAYEASQAACCASPVAPFPKEASLACSPVTLLPPATPSSLSPPSICKPADVLASVAKWGRGTECVGIADHSSSASVASSSDSGGQLAHGVDGRATAVAPPVAPADKPSTAPASLPSPPQKQLQARNPNAHVEEAHFALQRALNSEGGFAPRLLQDSTAALPGAAEWDLRGILRQYHRQHGISASQHPHSGPVSIESKGGDTDDRSSESDWASEEEEAADVWEWHFPFQQGGDARGCSPYTSATSSPLRRNGGPDKVKDKPVSHNCGHCGSGSAAPRASSLLSFYQALLSGAPATLNAVKDKEHKDTLVLSHSAVWRQQRRRLLERVLHHYDANLLWQAYVALFSTSITAANSLAPQSAVAALIEWARRTTTDAASAAREATNSLAVSKSPWVWWGTRRRSSNSDHMVTTAPTRQQQRRASENMGSDGNDGHGKERVKAISCPGQGGRSSAPAISSEGTYSHVPFARILQQREDFMSELQALEDTTQCTPTASAARPRGARLSPPLSPSLSASSLLTQMRTQAMLDGSLPPSVKLLHSQQRDAAMEAATSRSNLKFPPTHHQNQIRLDVVNAVATWTDANGGFYVCFGSEDGGLYLLGGNVGA
ncbi:hypothetical protein ABL78_0941 [Leptomonas seymouri]|uniref:Uncharacterized protein n=1 Tax=Leptomonas seymouri TaxID=5684 RepID=A0A0N1I9L8_LEPSE|nr:hypothetical protein ABL78_0941 [Leptomonas seymouri]|eukprot:KPI89973.1 hypothetical protein ABL78_0941 [Leptomonas seymouri]